MKSGYQIYFDLQKVVAALIRCMKPVGECKLM